MMFIEFSVHTLLILYSLCFQIQVIAGGKLMLENRLPYLCGGTFFVLLLRSLRKVHSKIGIKLYSSEGYTQTALIVALIKLFDSNYRAPKGTSLSTNTKGQSLLNRKRAALPVLWWRFLCVMFKCSVPIRGRKAIYREKERRVLDGQ